VRTAGADCAAAMVLKTAIATARTQTRCFVFILHLALFPLLSGAI
jgi:hypothetical protein